MLHSFVCASRGKEHLQDLIRWVCTQSSARSLQPACKLPRFATLSKKPLRNCDLCLLRQPTALASTKKGSLRWCLFGLRAAHFRPKRYPCISSTPECALQRARLRITVLKSLCFRRSLRGFPVRLSSTGSPGQVVKRTKSPRRSAILHTLAATAGEQGHVHTPKPNSGLASVAMSMSSGTRSSPAESRGASSKVAKELVEHDVWHSHGLTSQAAVARNYSCHCRC